MMLPRKTIRMKRIHHAALDVAFSILTLWSNSFSLRLMKRSASGVTPSRIVFTISGVHVGLSGFSGGVDILWRNHTGSTSLYLLAGRGGGGWVPVRLTQRRVWPPPLTV